MADLTPPSVEEFLQRFPQFADSEEYAIQYFLIESLRYVDDTWIEGDQQLAIMYLVAHWLESEGDGTSPGSDTVIPGAIQSESFGPISRSYATGTTASLNTNFNSTIYGRRFVELQSRSHPPILVI